MEIKNIIKHTLSDYLSNIECTDDAQINEQLKEKGCAVIKNFLSKEECKKLIRIGNDIIANNESSVSVESEGADSRVYGVDRVDEAFRLDLETRKLNKTAEKFYKTSKITYFQMLGHIKYNEGNTGSGNGWHRDSPFSHQFKFILYLNDVNEENGPFQYIAETHKSKAIYEYCKRSGINLGKYRFTEEEIKNIIKDKYEILTINGEAGDLLIADVKGLHRGKPLTNGERWATTRYYFKGGLPEEFKKLIAK